MASTAHSKWSSTTMGPGYRLLALPRWVPVLLIVMVDRWAVLLERAVLILGMTGRGGALARPPVLEPPPRLPSQSANDGDECMRGNVTATCEDEGHGSSSVEVVCPSLDLNDDRMAEANRSSEYQL